MSYRDEQPTPEAVKQMRGPAVLDFGANWCGICLAAESAIRAGLGAEVRHIKVADGPGLPLGRSFGVKLWPTLIFLRDGQEFSRLVRPTSSQAIADALARLEGGSPGSGDRG